MKEFSATILSRTTLTKNACWLGRRCWSVKLLLVLLFHSWLPTTICGVLVGPIFRKGKSLTIRAQEVVPVNAVEKCEQYAAEEWVLEGRKGLGAAAWPQSRQTHASVLARHKVSVRVHQHLLYLPPLLRPRWQASSSSLPSASPPWAWAYGRPSGTSGK